LVPFLVCRAPACHAVIELAPRLDRHFGITTVALDKLRERRLGIVGQPVGESGVAFPDHRRLGVTSFISGRRSASTNSFTAARGGTNRSSMMTDRDGDALSKIAYRQKLSEGDDPRMYRRLQMNAA